MKWLAILLCVLLVFSGCRGGEYMTGTGTALDPYIITTRADLEAVNDHLDAYYELGADINLAGSDWTPLGTFTGSLDGKHYRITGMTITTPDTSNWTKQGLFSETSGTFKDVAICNAVITLRGVSEYQYPDGTAVGILVGKATIGFSASGITVSGTIQKDGSGTLYSIGGLVGLWDPSSNSPAATQTITQCKAILTVTWVNRVTGSGLWGVGGLVGSRNGYGGSEIITSGISDCVSSLTVSGDATLDAAYAGGLIGDNQLYDTLVISGCTTVVDINGGYTSGGLIGYANYDLMITDCHTSGKVYGINALGGFIGQLYAYGSPVSITRCGADVDIKGDVEWLGGFTGIDSVNDSVTYTDCYALGDVESTHPDNNNGIGGFSGDGSSVTYVHCYSAGKVTVVDPDLYATGGFNGYGGAESATSCYWDTQASGQTRGVDGVGKTTTQMQTQSTFTGWDFDTVWNIASGVYPFLRTAFVTLTDGCAQTIAGVIKSFPWWKQFRALCKVKEA